MKCPHCLENFNDEQTWWAVAVGSDTERAWLLNRWLCPGCKHFIFELQNGMYPNLEPLQSTQGARLSTVFKSSRVWPKGVTRAPIPPEVPPEIAEDYREACLVLADSPKASAALSRRCLQHVLRTAAGVKSGNLADEIDQVIGTKSLPSTTARGLDRVRIIGNFAAHPMKSTTTGEIVDVEDHEAEWNLEVLESLFDFYYVLPARDKARQEAIDKKLAATKKT